MGIEPKAVIVCFRIILNCEYLYMAYIAQQWKWIVACIALATVIAFIPILMPDGRPGYDRAYSYCALHEKYAGYTEIDWNTLKSRLHKSWRDNTNIILPAECYLTSYPPRDCWDHTLHIAPDMDGDGLIVLDTITVKVEHGFALWSDGANGSNEFGMGDDINSWQSREDNRKRLKQNKSCWRRLWEL